MKCAECKYIRTCKEKAKEPNLGGCTSGIPIEKMGIRTNGDAIRAMTNQELAEFIEKAKMCGALITRETTSVECWCGANDKVLRWKMDFAKMFQNG